MGQHELVAEAAEGLNAEGQPEAIKRRRRRTCQCGKCKMCIGNARWEVVFREKFVDRDYYTGLRLTRRSPLTGF